MGSIGEFKSDIHSWRYVIIVIIVIGVKGIKDNKDEK
jgi:hypothetical protein